MYKRLVIFLILNFLALTAGNYFTGDGVGSIWYQELNKAPWTPPGPIFGIAWTIIMVCFSFYMAFAWEKIKDQRIILGFYIVQWILNVVWNPIFFTLHLVFLALVIIIGLALIIHFFLFKNWRRLGLISLLLLPYAIWLIIAISLNAYIYVQN